MITSTRTKVNILGLEMDKWQYESCKAYFGVGDDWATLASIDSTIEGKGHATHLLKEAKEYYESLGKRVGGTVALNDRMRSIYKHLGYKEYAD